MMPLKRGDDAMLKVLTVLTTVLLCAGAFADDGADWGRTGAMPEPQADSRGRAGAWWQPERATMSDGDKDVWGNRGVLFRAGGVAVTVELEAQVIPHAFEQHGIVCTSVAINNVPFAKNSYFLDSAGIKVANEALEALKEFPTDTVVVEGHTCDVGDGTYNHVLGLRRAQAVVDYLVDQGIDASRVGVKSYGETQPAVPNDTEPNRALNRRAVFQFTINE